MPRTASPRTARLINDRIVFDVLLEQGPQSRSQIQARTGLSRATVNDLVERMEVDGLIAEVGREEAVRRGPNALLYSVVADRAHVAGVEVRPDVILASVCDLTGRQVGGSRLPHHPGAEPADVVHGALAQALDAAGLDASTLQGVVVATMGLVDPETGDVDFVGALPTWHANLLPGLHERLGDVPVLIENEVNLAGLAEHRLGAARGHDTFALLSLGVALGMALVLDGRLYRGRSGGAGELDYLPAGLDGSTMYDLAGGEAILALSREAGVEAPDPESAVRKATPELLDTLAERFALAATGVCAVLDPGFIVLAGPVGRAGGEELARRIESRLSAATRMPTRVVHSTLEGNPVVRGAVLIALEQVLDRTFA
ncbi:putative NBD/HSP70 family sugar kinase [Catenulispora sp. GAS73]|uniref:ROK family transcriptional regulator n=1 Tax=Catenulispora sp. GAS73 TaxID=3156269 RepID=UPI00351248DA